MKLSKKTSRRQKEILERIKKGLPVAGLITGLVALSGCDNPLQPVGIEPNHVVGKYTTENREQKPPEPVVGTMPAKVPQQGNCTRTAGEEPVPPPPPPPPPPKILRPAGVPPPVPGKPPPVPPTKTPEKK